MNSEPTLLLSVTGTWLCLWAHGAETAIHATPRPPTRGPLTIHSVNPRWFAGDPFRGHPFHAANNTPVFNGDADGDSVLNLDVPAVRARHAAFIRKVVDTVNDLDHVLPGSLAALRTFFGDSGLLLRTAR